jgi:hypothetical protein
MKVVTLALMTATAGCGGAKGKDPNAGTGASRVEFGDPREPPLAKDFFTPEAIASLFSFYAPLGVLDADLGPEWHDRGEVVWAVTYAGPDDTFAPVTLILFKGHYRPDPLSDNQRDLLRRSGGYKDMSYGLGRKGYAMLAAGDGTAVETALIPSPRGRFELLVLVEVPKGGPAEAPGEGAYRALLMDYTVKLLEAVVKGMDEAWVGKK